MEQNNDIKVSHVINLPSLNVKAQVNMSIDSNTHIKQVVNIETCLLENQIEALQNKAVVKGKLGIKVLYVDIDNMYNTISDTVTFSETITNENISADSEININNSQFFTQFDNDERNLRITIEGNLDCFCNINEHVRGFNQESEGLITKKSVIGACNCIGKINKNCAYDLDVKLDNSVNKILSCDNRIIIEEVKCYDGYVLTSGQILSTIIYECQVSELNSIRIFNSSTPFKLEVEASGCDNDCLADLSAYIDMNSTQMTTDIGDDYTNIGFELSVAVSGYIYKNINMDIIEDLYSLDNELELENKSYPICKKSVSFKATENIDSEITLADEIAIDEILGMVTLSSGITNYSIKQDCLNVEGVINGNLLYLDENREIKHMATQLPFSINVKQEIICEVCAVHVQVVPTSCKCKIKRGNTLIVDYEVCVTGSLYEKENLSLIENVKYGKTISYEGIAFQIYIARPNESRWELCKRIHTTAEKLIQCNKENPTTYQGGEKVIVYR